MLEDNKIKSLADIPVGARGKIIGFGAMDKAYRAQLLAMGLTRGTEFTVIRKAPLGCPIEIFVRGFSLSLRKDEADALYLEQIACA